MKLKDKLFTMRISQGFYLEIQKYAQAGDMSVASLIRRAVKFWIKKNK